MTTSFTRVVCRDNRSRPRLLWICRADGWSPHRFAALSHGGWRLESVCKHFLGGRYTIQRWRLESVCIVALSWRSIQHSTVQHFMGGSLVRRFGGRTNPSPPLVKVKIRRHVSNLSTSSQRFRPTSARFPVTSRDFEVIERQHSSHSWPTNIFRPSRLMVLGHAQPTVRVRTVAASSLIGIILRGKCIWWEFIRRKRW